MLSINDCYINEDNLDVRCILVVFQIESSQQLYLLMSCLSSFMKAETVRILARLPPAPQSRAPVRSLLRTAAQENLPLILQWVHLRCVFFPFRCFSLLLLVTFFSLLSEWTEAVLQESGILVLEGLACAPSVLLCSV